MLTLYSLLRRFDARNIFVALCLLITAGTTAYAEDHDTETGSLSLQQAVQRAMQYNPVLAGFSWRQQSLNAQRQMAAQRPAYELGITADNVLGSGGYRSAQQHELTLSLASLIETGSKRQARIAQLDASAAVLDAEQYIRARDILAEVHSLFIASLSLQEKRQLAIQARQLAERSYQVLQQQARKGAAASADVSRAKAALSQARLHEATVNNRYENSRRQLAASWGEKQPDFAPLAGDLYAFSIADDLNLLYQRMAQSPAIQVYSSQERLQQATIRLARSQAATDIRWQVGITRFQETGDAAVSAGFSLPLFSGKRQQANVRVSEAALKLQHAEREAAQLNLHTRLTMAYSTQQQQIAAADLLRSDIIPLLIQAQDQTQAAYQQGRYSYLNWLDAQNELLQARLALIEAATTVWLNQILIEQLTASPDVASPAAALTR